MQTDQMSIKLQLIDKFSTPAKKIIQASDTIDSKMLDNQKTLNKIGADRSLIKKFQDQNTQLSRTAQKLHTAKLQTAKLGRELKNTAASGGKISKTMQKHYDASQKSIRRLNTLHGQQTSKLGGTGQALRSAGYETRNLATAQAKLGDAYAKTQNRMKTQAMQMQKSAAAQARFDKTLQKAANLTFVSHGFASVGATARRAIAEPINQLRAVERAKGKLRGLGVKDFGPITKAGEKLQAEYAYMDQAKIINSAYPLRSGIDNLSDEELAGVTTETALMAKATLATPEEAGQLTSRGFNIFKNQSPEMDNNQFSEKLGAVVTKTVEMFNTTGPGMKQAITRAGAGLTNRGVAMEEQFAALGMLQGRLEASDSGTAMKALAKESYRANDFFASHGMDIELLTDEGQMHDLADILNQMKNEYGADFNANIGADIQQAFGSEEAVKFFELLYGQGDALRAHTKSITEAGKQGGAYTRSIAKLQDLNNTDSELEIMQQNLDAAKLKFGTAMIPVLKTLTPLAEKLATYFSNTMESGNKLPTILATGTLGLAVLGTVIAPVITGFSALIVSSGFLAKSMYRTALWIKAKGLMGGGKLGGRGSGRLGGRGRGRLGGRGRGRLGGLVHGMLGGGAGLLGRKSKGGMAGHWGKGLMGRLGTLGKGVGGLGALMGAYDIGSTLFDNKLSTKEKAKRIATSAGGLGGAALGATIGSFILPGLGTAIGAGIGGIMGSDGGSMIADTVGDFFSGDDSPMKNAVKAGGAAAVIAGGVLTPAAAVQDTPAKTMNDNSQAHISVAVNAQPGLDEKQLADLVAAEVEKALIKQQQHKIGVLLYDDHTS